MNCTKLMWAGIIDGLFMGASIGLVSGMARAAAILDGPDRLRFRNESAMEAILTHTAGGAAVGIVTGLIHSFLRFCFFHIDPSL